MDSARLTPAERDRLAAEVLAERHPFPTSVLHEVLETPSAPPSVDTDQATARRRMELLGELWGVGYTRWRTGSYREDDLTKARRRRELNEALYGAPALSYPRGTPYTTEAAALPTAASTSPTAKERNVPTRTDRTADVRHVGGAA